mgnify:FL=1
MEFNYKAEDFDTPAPYEEVLSIDSDFERNIAYNKLAKNANAVGVKRFNKLWNSFVKESEPKNQSKVIDMCEKTNFSGQPIELRSGVWKATDDGIYKDGQNGESIVASACPITITKIVTDIDTGEQKVELAYSKCHRWQRKIVPKSIIANSRKIVDLVAFGISVTSETAKNLVDYLFNLENLNMDLIPEVESVSRLGMIPDVGFSPYIPDVTFDDNDYKNAYNSIQPYGKFESWLELFRGLRGTNVELRIVIASAFASVLVSPLHINPFFVHIWSGESGSGKTVALMCAASVWGNPDHQGNAYIQTFNATQVGLERTAAFFNHCPYMIDELQLLKDSHGRNKFDIVYLLSEGRGRTRGNRSGGIDVTPTWANCIITTGETPLTASSSGAGAINRVISIECSPDKPIITDGHTLVYLLHASYGHAGKMFVDNLYNGTNVEVAQKIYDDFFNQLLKGESTEKQAMAAACILTADKLATDWIFQDNQALTTKEIGQFLATKDEVNIGKRGYEFVCDWIAQNANKMRTHQDGDFGDVYGTIENNVAYIIATIFDNVCKNEGYDPKPVKAWMKKNGKIKLQNGESSKRYTIMKRVNGVSNVRCIAVIMADDFSDISTKDLPFDD